MHPGGTRNRWQIIAQYVSLHADCPERTQDEIIEKCQEIKKKQVDEEFRMEWKKKKDGRIGENTEPSLANASFDRKEGKEIIDKEIGPKTVESEDKKELWTAKEQQLLEAALKSVPSSDPERWDKISQVVATRSKKQCIARFKEIAAAVKAKKAAQ